MQYRNKKTGVIIDALGIISGEDWEEIPSSQPVPEKEAKSPAKRKTKSAKDSRK